MIRFGVCGFGYWGPNLVRAFSNNPDFEVVAIADRRPDAQAKAKAVNRDLQVFDAAEDLIDSGLVDAIAVATPVSTHFGLASRALRRGLHVLVEKPLAASVAESEELVALAEANKAKLIVDHIYVFSDPVLKLKSLKDAGVLGTVSYFDSLRVNLGLFQPDMSVLWDLAPHDFSIMDYLFEEEPVHVEATGYCHVNAGIPDITYVTAHYASNMIAHLNLSWMSPVKARRIAIGGSKQMVVWDDLNADERLKIYDSGIHFQSPEERATIIPNYRIGDVHSPRLPMREPLSRLAEHFAHVIKTSAPSQVDGKAGLRVVRLLERSQAALDETFRRVPLADAAQ